MIFEHSFDQFKRGIIEPSEWARHENIAKSQIQTDPSAREMWEGSGRTSYGPEFVALIDGFYNEIDASGN